MQKNLFKKLILFSIIFVFLVPPASANKIFLSVCQFAGLSAKVFAIISSKGVFDPLITMAPSKLRENVPFGRYEYFYPKISISPNTLKIESWVPQAMDNPMPPTFGRTDASRGSSVEKTKITDSTKRHENRVAGAPDHGRSNPAHFWSHRRVAREFSRNNCNNRLHQTP